MPIIEVQEMTKTYGDKTVVDHVSFSVEEGEIFSHSRPERGREDLPRWSCRRP